MHKRSFLLPCVMMFALSALLFAESDSEHYKTVDYLIIHGLKRTKPIVVEKLLDPFIGIPADTLDMGEVRTVLRESGLFYRTEVSLEIDDSESVSLVVSVQEKWTLIPIPVIMGDKNGVSGGGTLIETNAFGLNHTAILAALFSGDEHTVFTSYATPPGKSFPYGLAAAAAFSNGEVSVTDDGEHELLSYTARKMAVIVKVRHDLTQRISFSAGFGYREASVEDSILPSAQVLPLSAAISAQKSDWNGVFLSQRSAEIETSWSFALEGDPFLTLSGECIWQQPFTRQLRLMLGASAYRADKAPLVFSEGPSAARTAILPGDFRSNSIAGTSLGIEGVFADFGAGMFSFFLSYQASIAEDITDDPVFAQGPHFGIRCYLKKIAFPALDLGAAYNAESGIWNGVVSIGMQK